MRVLAIETATPVAGAALVDAGGVLAARTVRAPMRHLEWLAAAVDGLLRDAGTGPDGVEAVAVGRGPGGFTGLRIGIATAAAWARARRVPVLGVPTLEVLAASASASGLVFAVLDAHRGEVAAALYRLGQDAEPVCLVPAVVAAPDAAVAEIRLVLEGERALHRPLVVAGDGLARHADALRAALGGAGARQIVERPDAYPSAETAGRLARPRLLRGARDLPAGLLPVYGRRPAVRLWQESPAPPGSVK
ncbi:MAG TPA: tRNA (adenosine(37)-N6)-threonylcarbamoyltransferase complex dimerization subunit type 1 TsaB [bacterium]|nr:tRNA (adenosine(37)-N6)-threonylcarbamoyltransferase complex dimerization subunit type 1 TsaB [bacterium]